MKKTNQNQTLQMLHTFTFTFAIFRYMMLVIFSNDNFGRRGVKFALYYMERTDSELWSFSISFTMTLKARIMFSNLAGLVTNRAQTFVLGHGESRWNKLSHIEFSCNQMSTNTGDSITFLGDFLETNHVLEELKLTNTNKEQV